MVGAIIGAIMVAFIINGLNLLNIPAPFHPIVTGVVIIVALIFNQGSVDGFKFGGLLKARKPGSQA